MTRYKTVLLFLLATQSFASSQSQAHVWTTPTSVDATSPGNFGFTATLLVEDDSVAFDLFEITDYENVRNLSGNATADCSSPVVPGEEIRFEVRGQLADSRIPGRVTVRLAVCSDGPGETEWTATVVANSHPSPHVWLVPMVVLAEADGSFSVSETLIVGAGGLAQDYGGFDNVENTNLSTSVGDGFCSYSHDEGSSFESSIRGQLLDPLKPGRMELWLVACAPSAWEGQAAWGAEVLIENRGVATTRTSMSGLRGLFGGQP